MTTFLRRIWAERRLEGHEKLEPEDPGVPMWYGTATLVPTFHPWSAYLGAVTRIQKVINFQRLYDRVMELCGPKDEGPVKTPQLPRK